MTNIRLTVLLSMLLASIPALSDEAVVDRDATTVDAQRIEMYLDREMRAFGDAEIRQSGQLITGDRIDYNFLGKTIHATGNVHVEQRSFKADGTELQLQTEDRDGEMKDPVFHMGAEGEKKSRGSAKTILFEGPIRERLKSMRYTTCEDGRDDWFLRAGEMEVDHHTETATATNASIEFKGVPILYTPWIDFPFANQRKSGFLTPTYGSTSKSGFEFELPYYWNIAPNRDATITPRYLSKRGVQWIGEYRYLENSYNGMLAAEYLPNDDQTGKNRFAANIKHSQTFDGGWAGGIQFERVSDNDYFSDLSTHVTSTSTVNLPQQANLSYSGIQGWAFSALVQQFQTLDNASYPYQRLPQIVATGYEELGPVDARLTSEYVRFDKNSKAPLSVTGSRFTVYPSLALPLLESYGYVTPKLGLHYTKYDLTGNLANPNIAGTNYQSDSRAIPIFSVDSGLYFDRDMRVVKNRYTQTLEPRLYYVYIPHHDQSALPNFDSALSDLNITSIFAENQFVGGDRVNDANQATLALTSRLIDQNTGAQRLAATAAERFYFTDQKVVLPGGIPRTGMHSDLLFALTAQLSNGWHADSAWQYNTDTGSTARGNVGARYQPEPGKVFNLAYRYAQKGQTLTYAQNGQLVSTQSGLDQIDVSAEWPLGGNWYGLGRLNYSLEDNPPIERKGPAEYLAGLEYNAGCWQGRAVVHRLANITSATSSSTSYNTALFFQLEFGGLSRVGSSPLDVLKRNIPGYTSTGIIPSNSQ